jgi:hypothetical protein
MNKDINILETEKKYLNCLLNAADEGIRIETSLKKNDFYCADCWAIFETINDQWNKEIMPDIATLHEALPDIPLSVISSCTSFFNGYSNANYYEKEILEASRTRQFYKALRLANEEHDRGVETDTIINNLLPAVTALSAARNEAGIKTAAEILSMEFPEMRWIIPGLIGEGLTLFVGAPKIGKSWLAYSLAIAAATGGGFLGSYIAQKTDTLYLAFEDKDRRINYRLKQLNAPKTDNLKTRTEWLDGYIGLESYLKTNRGIGLVIIDTLQGFAKIENMNDYSLTTKAMARLKRIADDLGIAIVLIHHTKKIGNNHEADWMEAALGSTGLTGAADSIIYMSRNREGNTATLNATGRDAADISHNLAFDQDCGSWTITLKLDNPIPSIKPKTRGRPKNGDREKTIYGGYEIRCSAPTTAG